MLRTILEVKSRMAVLAVSGLAAVSIGAGVMSFAAFTDDADVTTNGFSTGTVSIATTPSSTLFSVSNIMPGYSSTQALTVDNDGSVDVEYTMSTSATNADSKNLRDQLTLTIKTKDSDSAGCANWNGTQLYDGSLANGAISTARALEAQASEVLCFRVTLPSSTGNAYQGATTSATFTFSATTP
jgi:hypothetical protein